MAIDGNQINCGDVSLGVLTVILNARYSTKYSLCVNWEVGMSVENMR
jgi:hypothetical protein